ncbi:MAG: hypothetical protein M3355_12120 [Actinomycetota bacterium]|nr:hypothetical protein [Actinomycetota bacterium]
MAIRNILLRIAGDGDDARRTLRRFAGEVKAVDGIEAKAKIKADADQAKQEMREFKVAFEDIDGDEARARIDLQSRGVERQIERIRQRLANLDKQESNPNVDIRIANELAKLERLEAKLRALAAKRYEVDVDVDQEGLTAMGVLSRLFRRQTVDIDQNRGRLYIWGRTLGAVVAAVPRVMSAMFGMTRAFSTISGALGNATSGMSMVGQGAAVLTSLVGILIATFMILSGVLGPIIAGLGALVLSLGAAAAGLGALAIGAVAALGPIAALGFGLFQAFQEGGAAVERIKQALSGLGDAFTSAVKPGVDAIMGSLAPAIRLITPMVESLKPAFTALGQAGGQAVGILSQGISRMGPGLSKLIEGTSRLVGPLTQGLVALGEVFLNIANAAMPHLVSGAQSFAGWLEKIAASTRNLDLSTVVDHLSMWWDIAKGLFNTFTGIFTAAEPLIRNFVQWLATGAENLAKWADSAKGQADIKAFFEDTLPAAKALVELIGTLVVEFLKFAETAAPAVERLFKTVQWLVNAISDVFQFLNRGPGPFFDSVMGQLLGLGGASESTGRRFRASMDGMGRAAVGFANGAAAAMTRGIPRFRDSGFRLTQALNSGLKQSLPAVGRTGIQLAQAAERGLRGAQSKFGKAGREAVMAMARAMRGAGNAVMGAMRQITNGIDRAANPVKEKLSKAGREAVMAMARAMKAAGRAVISATKSIVNGSERAANASRGQHQNAGRNLGNAVGSGLKSAAGAVSAAARALGARSAQTAGSAKGQFVSAGRSLGDGLAEGLEASIQRVGAAAQRLAQTAANAMRAAAQIRSPSKVFRYFGEMMGEGLIEGLRNATPKVIRQFQRIMEEIKKLEARENLGRRGKLEIKGLKLDAKDLALGERRRQLGVRQKSIKDLNRYLDALSSSVLSRFGEHVSRGLRFELDERLRGSMINVSPAVAAGITMPTRSGWDLARDVGETHVTVQTQGTGQPDPQLFASQLERIMRGRGRRR